jgi:2-polyprenyl-3-methyl-5-hydroxy-6-metoxy-1,4-benzoquinol methylase
MSDFDAKARTWDDDPQKVERARRVAEAIAARVPGLSRMTVLEYGSGTGLLGLALQPRVAALTLADSSREMTAVAREKIAASGARNVTAVLLDLTADAAPGERYDLVCTLLTLHHIADVGAVLRRFHELLVPGGVVCVSDLEEEDGSFHPPGAAAHRGFHPGALARQLEAAGFRDVRTERVTQIEKQTAGGLRSFPVFLAVARRD